MPGHKGPPPGAMPSMMPSPDVASMMQQGMAQKMSGGNPAQAQQMMGAMGGQGAPGTSGFQHQHTPREVTDFSDELKRAGQDLFESFKGILGLERPPKSPDEVAELQQFHQKWQGLSAEQQSVAQERIQAEMQRKEMMRQEDEMKAQQEAQEEQQNQLVTPHGKVTGQGALDKLQQDRKGMGGASG